MPPLAAIERFFERLFERPSARLFRARLQPVQLQRRIERAMESERLAAADRTLVPNRFVVHLHPADLDAFGDMTASLATELADGALVFARARRYTLVDRPKVDLMADPTVERADILVTARFADPIAGHALRPDEITGQPVDGQQVDRATGDDDPFARSNDTMVFTVPRPAAPRARLTITAPGQPARSIDLGGTELTIGRAADNELVLADGRVSRHHARITARRGTYVFRDLGSTNGSRVNAVTVTELVLGAGDRIELGDSVIVVEAAGEVG